METNPLFYKSVVPLNRDKHRDWRLADPHGRYGFARSTHVIPAVVDEFTTALQHLPIVFVPSKPYPTTVFLVGVRPSRNLLVDADGRWTGGYVPAFLRRYPFMRGEINGGAPVTCVDETSELLGPAVGERLFDEEGKDSPLLRKTTDLVEKYYLSARRTGAFLSMVNDLQLLRQVTIETNVGGGNSSVIHGFMTVDEAKLNALPAGDLVRLRDAGFLAPIYAHLFSLRCVDTLRKALLEAPREAGGSEDQSMPARDDEDGSVEAPRSTRSRSSARATAA